MSCDSIHNVIAPVFAFPAIFHDLCACGFGTNQKPVIRRMRLTALGKYHLENTARTKRHTHHNIRRIMHGG
jgi:hypothetical protein